MSAVDRPILARPLALHGHRAFLPIPTTRERVEAFLPIARTSSRARYSFVQPQAPQIPLWQSTQGPRSTRMLMAFSILWLIFGKVFKSIQRLLEVCDRLLRGRAARRLSCRPDADIPRPFPTARRERRDVPAARPVRSGDRNIVFSIASTIRACSARRRSWSKLP